jgi:predicted nucleic acid-binding protein
MSDRPIFLFDACAVVAVLLGETGGAAAAKLISDGNDCRVTAVIVSEAAYVLLRVGADAAELQQDIDSMGLTPTEVPDECGVLAANLRHRHAGLSTADALHLAVAQHHGWVLLSSDGPLLLAAHLDGTSTHVIANSAGVIWSPPIPSESSRMPTAN